MNTTGFNITAVERDTGLSKDLLRMWERRYGFPAPTRDANGERVYPRAQVERLRLIKRLIDQGFRPGKILVADDESLQTLLDSQRSSPPETGQTDCTPYIELLRQGDLLTLRNALQQQIVKQGLQNFVLDTAKPLTVAVGEAWMEGSIRVHEEHAYTETLKSLLRQSMSSLNSGSRPTLLLTTVPEEEHALGLLMAEVLFTLEGARCISLGTRTPLLEIADAAQRHQVDAVALSFSAAFPLRQAGIQVAELRRILPASIELWLGGSGSVRITLPEGVFRAEGVRAPLQMLADWHARQAAKPL